MKDSGLRDFLALPPKCFTSQRAGLRDCLAQFKMLALKEAGLEYCLEQLFQIIFTSERVGLRDCLEQLVQNCLPLKELITIQN